jgi:WD40 repeat protein
MLRIITLISSFLLAALVASQGRPVFEWIKGGHTRPVGVVVSSDGKLLLTGSDDGTVKIWRTENGTLLLTIPGLSNQLTDADLSKDGTLVATTGWDNTIRIFRTVDGSAVRTITPVHVYPSSIDFSPDGQFIASCGEDGVYPSSAGSAKIWKVSDGTLVRTLPFSSIVQANNLKFSPDGQHLAVAGGHIDIGGAPLDCRVKVFRVSDGLLKTTFSGHIDPVIDVRWHPNGEWVVSGGVMDDNAIRVWRYDTGQPVQAFFEQNELNNPQFTPDGQFLINGFDWSSNKKVKVRRVSDWSVVDVFPADNMASLAVSVNSQTYFVGGDNYGRPLRQFDLATGAELQDFSGHWEPARVVRVSHNGQLVASGGEWPESRINIWDAETGNLLRSIFHQDQGIRDIAFSPDDLRIVVGSGDSAVIYNVDTGAVITEMQHEGVTVVTAVEYSPDGQWIATANTAGRVRIWTASGSLVATAMHNAQDIDFSPDGTKLAAGGGTAFVIWTVPDLGLVGGQNNWPDNIYSLDWAPDGSKIITGDSSGAVEIWSTTTLAQLATLPAHPGGAYVTRFSPDGSTILTAGADARIRLIKTADNSTLRVWDRELADTVFRIDYAPNGNSFAIARADGTVALARLWDSGVDNLERIRGVLAKGGYLDMLESDNLSASFTPGAVFSTTQAPIELILSSRVQWHSPATITFQLESFSSTSNIQQSVELYNLETAGWTLVDTRSLSPTESQVSVSIGSLPDQYIQNGTGLVRARLMVRQSGPIFAYPWQYRIDTAKWTVGR